MAYTKNLVLIKGVADLKKEEKEREAAAEKAEQELQFTPQSGLSTHIDKIWRIHRNARWNVTLRLLACLRARKGEYSAAELALFESQGGANPVFIKLTGTKCRQAAAWLRDLLLPTGEDYPFSLEHTPIPSLEPSLEKAVREQVAYQIAASAVNGEELSVEDKHELAETIKKKTQSLLNDMAEDALEAMSDEIKDKMAEGYWERALEEYIDDFATYPAAFLKGPYDSQEKVLTWSKGKPVVELKTKKVWRRVSPFDMYPSPYVSNIQKGDLIEHIRYTRSQFYNLVGLEGFSSTEIYKVLDEHDGRRLHGWLWEDWERRSLEASTTSLWWTADDTIDALHYWGDVQGKDLKHWGIDSDDIDDYAYYPVDAIKVGSHVIRCVINDNPLGQRPYHGASWDSIPGAIWGTALPEQMHEHQQIVNATTRSLLSNLSIASGPQISVNVSQIPPGEDLTGIYPHKIWQWRNDPMSQSSSSVKPIDFFQPSINAEQLMSVMSAFESRADDVTNVPKYASGSSNDPTANNATAMSMLMSNAAKGIRKALSNIDLNVIKPTVKQMFTCLMLEKPNEFINGDIDVVANGSVAVLIKEQAQMRMQSFLRDAGAMLGPNTRDKLIKENARLQGIDIEKELEQDKELMMQQQQQQEAMSQQAAMSEAMQAQSDQQSQAAASRVF